MLNKLHNTIFSYKLSILKIYMIFKEFKSYKSIVLNGGIYTNKQREKNDKEEANLMQCYHHNRK